MNTKYDITIIRPAGNITALVKGIVPMDQKKNINDRIMKEYPKVEQVGFYDVNKSTITLEMAGGEFCGNALRSLAYLLLEGQAGTVSISTSGNKKSLTAGVKLGYSFAEMPEVKELAIKNIAKDMIIVPMDGITHVVIKLNSPVIRKNYLISYAKELLVETGLAKSEKASGAMFVTEDNKLFPVVWVRDIKTLILETSCASGTSAVALAYAKTNYKDNVVMTLLQPSGMPLTAVVKKDGVTFNSEICGSTIIIENKTTSLELN